MPARAVLASPHPDDETFGYAGIVRWLLDHEVDCTIVAVTDGEASHAASDVVDPDELASVRRWERTRALRALGAAAVPVKRLRLPDGAVAAHETRLVIELCRLVARDTCLVVPWAGDAHADHQAVTHAAWIVSATRGCPIWEVPIWGRVHGFATRCSVLDLGSFHRQKVVAAREFRSQRRALGPGPNDGPVLRPFELRALLQPTELVVMR